MAKSFFDHKQFQSYIFQNAPATSDRFEVAFTLPAGIRETYNIDQNVISLLCEELQIPGYTASNVPVKIGAWTEFRNINLEFLTQDVVFTFISDKDLNLRGIFEKWIESTVDPVSKEVAFQNEVIEDILLRVLDRQNNVRAEYLLLDCIPKLVNINQMAWSNTAQMRISVSFAARKWVRMPVEAPREDDLLGVLRREGTLRRIFNLFR